MNRFFESPLIFWVVDVLKPTGNVTSIFLRVWLKTDMIFSDSWGLVFEKKVRRNCRLQVRLRVRAMAQLVIGLPRLSLGQIALWQLSGLAPELGLVVLS